MQGMQEGIPGLLDRQRSIVERLTYYGRQWRAGRMWYRHQQRPRHDQLSDVYVRLQRHERVGLPERHRWDGVRMQLAYQRVAQAYASNGMGRE